MEATFFEPIKFKRENLTSEGYLKVRCTVLKSGVMQYLESEVVQNGDPNKKVLMYVSPEALSDLVSLQTLSGKNVTLGEHFTPSVDVVQPDSIPTIGTVVGEPYVAKSPLVGDPTYYLYADFLIKDKSAVDGFFSSNIPLEVSAGYDAKCIMDPGVTDEGQPYDGFQTDLAYNHFTIIGPGEGRSGRTVRVLNKKGLSMTDFSLMKIGNRRVRIHNEDVDAARDEIDQMDNQKSSLSSADVDKILKELDDLKTERDKLKSLQAEIESKYQEAAGQLKAYKEQLDEALDPDIIAQKAEDMVDEQREAEEILNANGLEDKKEICNSSGRSRDRKAVSNRRHGHELRKYIVNSVREAQERAPLTDEELNDQSFVKGMFKALHEKAYQRAEQRRYPTGHQVVAKQIGNANAPRREEGIKAFVALRKKDLA